MVRIIDSSTETNKDITALFASSVKTIAEDCLMVAQVRITGLTATAATLTVGLRLKDASDNVLGESYEAAQLKLVGSATRAMFTTPPVRVKRGEKVCVAVLSTNVLDTAAGVAVEYIDVLAAARNGTLAE